MCSWGPPRPYLRQSLWNVSSPLRCEGELGMLSLASAPVVPGLLLGNDLRMSPLCHALPIPDSMPWMGVIQYHQSGFEWLDFWREESNFRNEGMNGPKSPHFCRRHWRTRAVSSLRASILAADTVLRLWNSIHPCCSHRIKAVPGGGHHKDLLWRKMSQHGS